MNSRAAKIVTTATLSMLGFGGAASACSVGTVFGACGINGESLFYPLWDFFEYPLIQIPSLKVSFFLRQGGWILLVAATFAAILLTLVVREFGPERLGSQRRSLAHLVIGSASIMAALFFGANTAFIYINESSFDLGELSMSTKHVPIVGGIPFVISALIWWLALRRG